MKLQKLTIRNIASLTDAEIDFEAAPLGEADVFLISGKTGAGKSTILDAVCLALYGSTPRLESSVARSSVTLEGEEIKVKSPAQLLRKSTGEGGVSLTFTGNNGKEYEATWSVRRSRGRANGALQGAKRTLVERGREMAPMTREAEIAEEIRRAVGLDFSQFCRTTMLAQGEFSKFLNSKDSDKAEILEKITGTDIYARIGSKIYEITDRRRRDWEEARKEAENVTLLSVAEKTALRQKIAFLNLEYGSLERMRKSISIECDCMEKIAEAGDSISRQNKVLTGLRNDYQEFLAGISAKEEALKTDREKAAEESSKGILERKRAKEKEVEEMGLAGLRQTRENLAEKAASVVKEIQNIKTLEEAYSKLDTDRSKIEEKEKERQVCADAIESLTPRLQVAEELEKMTAEIYDGQKDTIDKFAREMRARLREGDQCPVCRQKIQVLPESEEVLRKIIEKYRDDWQNAKKALDYIKTTLNKATTGQALLDKQLAREKETLKNDTLRIEKRRNEIETACVDLGMAPAGTEDRKADEFMNDAMTFLTELTGHMEEERKKLKDVIAEGEKKEKEVKDIQKEYEKAVEVEARISKAEGELKTLHDTRCKITELMPDWTDDKAVGTAGMKKKVSGGMELVADISAALNTLNGARIEKEKREKELAGMPRHEEGHTVEKLREEMRELGGQMRRIGEEKGAASQRIADDGLNRARAAFLKEKAAEMKLEYDRWAILNEYLGSAKGDKFRKVAQSYVLESLIDSANRYMETLSGRYRLRAVAGSFVISVEDAYLGGALRTANTLSGGETFLVSLSLALGLSDIGETLKVETLFIDEGFGTLSGDHLENAISTLRTLHARTGRQVGIISHVEELRERIRPQIRVEQDVRSSSSRVQIS